MNTPQTDAERAFRDWMDDLITEIADNAIPKARVYGTAELSHLGATLHQVRNTTTPTPPATDRRNLQDALWFYTAGKLARWTAAVRREEQPSRDTVYDLLVYAVMWLKVEETGEWWPDNEEPIPAIPTATLRAADLPQHTVLQRIENPMVVLVKQKDDLWKSMTLREDESIHDSTVQMGLDAGVYHLLQVVPDPHA